RCRARRPNQRRRHRIPRCRREHLHGRLRRFRRRPAARDEWMAQESCTSRQHHLRQVHRDRRRNSSIRRRQHLRYARLPALKGGRAAMDFAELAALASGHAEARAIQTALKLGIFDILESSPLDAAALAAAISANRRATALIANAMAALGLLAKRADRYALTDTSRRYLLRSSEEYLGGLILFDEAIFETWTHLEQTIRTGAPAAIRLTSPIGSTSAVSRWSPTSAAGRGRTPWRCSADGPVSALRFTICL